MGNEQTILRERALCDKPDLNLKECLDQLSTGDILLTHASGTFSGAIEFLTQSPWSHVGIVVKDKRYCNGETLVWETMRREDRMDVVKGKIIPGATLSFLREKIEIYSGSYMAFRKLILTPRLRKRVEERFPAIISQYDGVPFDENQAHYALAVDGGRFVPESIVRVLEDNDENPHKMFCSRLAAITFNKLGLLDFGGKHPIQFIPKDFSSKCTTPLNLAQGCSLGPEFYVKLPHLSAPTQDYRTLIRSAVVTSNQHNANDYNYNTSKIISSGVFSLENVKLEY